MRKSIVGSCLIAWAIEAGLADAAFVIKLKNGNEFVTGRHWQEGKQVMFDVYDGVFGVDKALVLKIDQSDKTVPFAIDAQQVRNEKPQPLAGKPQAETNKSSPVNNEVKIKREPDDPILKEFEALKQKFSTMSGMLTSELSEYSRNVSSLKRRIQTSGESNHYLDEFTELHKIGDNVENILNQRN
jgi:hypothetical protein